jgi:Salmonella virulence plasmid 65kDa B protein/FG-GAP-like repeat
MRLSNVWFTMLVKMKASSLGLTALLFTSTALAQYSASPTQFDVTDAGAAKYTILLYSAPSKGNLDVKLALQYSSQAGNGAFGLGWNLTGVSSITRCPKTIAEEGVRQGVKNDSSDIFCLDGQKLRATEGPYGANGTKYRTAIESYSLIESFGSQAGGPQYFRVRTKSGLVMQFGASDEVNYSRLEHPVKGVARVWMVNQIADRFNNEINFTYYKNPAMGEQLLTTVTHANGKTEIQYQARPANDQIIKFDDGVQLGSTGLIASKIVISDAPVSGGTQQLRAFKEYRMGYTQSTITRRSLLTSIQECAGSDVCLPAVIMNYQSADALGFTAGDAVAGGNNVLVVDSSGKGKQQVIANDPIKIFNLSYGYGGAGVGTGGILFNPAPNSSAIAFDIDGDSRTDFQISFPKKDSYSYCSYTKLAGNATTLASCDNSQYGIACFADLNGDGISEALYYGLSGLSLHSPSYLTVRETLSGSTASRVLYLGNELDSSSANNAINSLARCRAIDLDGDGRAEIIVADKVLSYSNNQLQTNALNLSTMMLGDFNGDGKTDAVTQQWAAASLSYGNGKFDSLSPGSQVPMPVGNYQYKPITCTGDFNGDGRTDFVSVPFGVVHIMLSNGNGFTDITIPNIAASLGSIHCGDFNGDGLTDLYVGTENRYYYNTLPGAVDALANVNNGLDYSHQVEYKSITDDSIYTRLAGAMRPQVDLQTPIQVVSRVTEQTGSSLLLATNYRYVGLRADLHRRGTLGFSDVTSINENNGIEVVTHYLQDYPYVGIKSQQIKSKGGRMLDYALYRYDARGLGGVGAYTSQYAQIINTRIDRYRSDLNGNALSAESDAYEMDGFGNIVTQTHTQSEGKRTVTSHKTITNVYTNDTDRWLLGQLISSNNSSSNLRDLPTTMQGSAINAASQTGYASIPATSPTPAELQVARTKAAMASILSLLLED